jgi:hypothetical protein
MSCLYCQRNTLEISSHLHHPSTPSGNGHHWSKSYFLTMMASNSPSAPLYPRSTGLNVAIGWTHLHGSGQRFCYSPGPYTSRVKIKSPTRLLSSFLIRPMIDSTTCTQPSLCPKRWMSDNLALYSASISRNQFIMSLTGNKECIAIPSLKKSSRGENRGYIPESLHSGLDAPYNAARSWTLQVMSGCLSMFLCILTISRPNPYCRAYQFMYER